MPTDALMARKPGLPVQKLSWILIGIAIMLGAGFAPSAWGLSGTAIKTLGVLVATILWWITEAIPIPISGLLVLPLLHITGAASFDRMVSQSFGDPFVPFMIGCLALSVAFSQSGLGKRITYITLDLCGTKVTNILNAYFWIPFAISAFITDLAVVALMYPIAVSLARSVGARPGKSNFGLDLMFAITFGGVIGGLCTPSGVPSNIIAIRFLEKNAGLTVSFLDWSIIATPIAIMIGLASQWLTKKFFPPEIDRLPFGAEVIRKELNDMGPWTLPEKTTLTVFCAAVVLWMTGEYTQLPIAVVSLVIIALLAMPGFSAVKSWREIETNLEWGSLMLMIGGFALGVAALESGLVNWLGQYALKPLANLPAILQPFAVTLLVAIDSLGFSSFTAAASVNVPMVISYAQHHGFSPASLAMSAGLASSTHFILVTESLCFVLTYSSGYYTFRNLFKIGTVLTILSAFIIALVMAVFGSSIGTPLH